MKQNLRIGDTAKSLSKDQIAAIRNFLGADILIVGTYAVAVRRNIRTCSGIFTC